MSIDSLFVSFQSALAGRYSIDRELGRGGSGIVYLAREVHLDRLVAIKLLPPEKAADPTLRERFIREARLAAKLSHPNIIPIHSVEDAGGFVFFVMAFVDGETLAQRVRTRGPVNGTEGSRIIREVAWALAYAHGQGLVHRDVKPDNILLEIGTGRVLVADFGIASAAGDATGGPISGTPEFMSPEAVLGKDVDPRSDVYALGATAYYAFSGRLPFEGKTATEVLAKQVSEAPPPLASLGLTVPRKLAALVDHCLAKSPDQRPASADALAEKLGTAIQQRRELPAVLRSFVKRGSRMNGGGTLIALSTVLWGSIGVSALTDAIWGFGAFAILSIGAPFGYMVYAARKLLRSGFVHGDIGPAFKQEIEQAKEEIASAAPTNLPRLEAFLKMTMRVSAALTGVAFVTRVVAMTFLPLGDRLLRYAILNISTNVGVFAWTTLVVTAIGYLATVQQRSDVDAEFWGKLWLSRIGKAAFRFANRVLGRTTVGAAMTHRATELSLGLAAEQLYESLPRDTQRALAGLPDVLHRLQEDAQLLRKRHDEINEALSGSSPTSAEYASTRALRDQLHTKLGETVGALETVRLNLLRLHAGQATVESLTTHLGIAAEVSAEVERLVAAHQEIDRSLQFPRAIAPSPA